MFATLVVVALATADWLSAGGVRTVVGDWGSQVWMGGSTVARAIGNTGIFTSRRALQRENDALRSQIAVMQEKAALYDVLSDENASLRSIVHLAENSQGVTAPITSSIYASPYGTFMIGAGESEGVSVGSLVLSGDEDGFVVGRVSSASAHRALVAQIFAPGSAFDGIIAGATVTVKGHGGGNARAEIPRGVAVQVNEPVRAPAYGGRVLGIVSAVESNPTSASQTAYIALPVALGTISYVYVIPPEE